MDLASVGLVSASIVMFAATLSLATRPVQSTGTKKIKMSCKRKDTDIQRAIVIKLPRGKDIPEDYVLDLRVSLSRGKKQGVGEKGNETNQQVKKFYRGLDEYL